jgi:hypothetical protein
MQKCSFLSENFTELLRKKNAIVSAPLKKDLDKSCNKYIHKFEAKKTSLNKKAQEIRKFRQEICAEFALEK